MWICVTGCKSPFAIVVSGSMEPGIRRALDIPIVHRVIQVHERRDTGEIDILTKGDFMLPVSAGYNDIVSSEELWGTAVACALIFWKMWICVTGCKSPFAIVVSGSMEPGIRRALDIPIVHRVIQVHESRDTGEIDILTKGDANRYDDRIFYAPGQRWLQQHRIIGRVMG
ncbi:hypothetical protein BUALT_Bualt18G0080600 [Buddleja alternifolia]|uniref:Signal peptidase complex catalytic subunit SEC11 n=1 Tax=Buddleja alternifolia TaxID=168488 RepID=A0AAV6WBX5_9LAMI|nr:hypothetical protein BUALT_Bualt18G0080600 [Buddleja alternifolia]